MQNKIITLFILMTAFAGNALAQQADSTNFSIYYSSPKKYIIAEITVSGIKYLDKSVLIQLSGLKAGDEIEVPGEAVTDAINRLWKQGLFSDVKISAKKIVKDKIWIDIELQERPRLSKVNYFGVSKSEKEDIESKVLLLRGSQITDHQLNSAERVIKGIFHEKGFLNTEVNVVQRDDSTKNNSVILDINVDKKKKVKVNDIIIHGNKEVKEIALERAMKKTNARKLRNFFRTKKFLQEEYKKDKGNLIKKYNEKGYRDAIIVKDTVYPVQVGKSKRKSRVNVEIWVKEGNQYHFGDIKWVGNTVYPSEFLNQQLGLKKGDIFNRSELDKQLFDNERGLNNLYLDKGYLFFILEPVEVAVENDTIDYEMRIYEGKQATIDKVVVTGNTKTHEHVARRELRTYPGDLFSKTNIMRSYRELAKLGHFNPEAIDVQPIPNRENGTVDIHYNLEEKANDQIELSGGYGAKMFMGSVGLKFANFSLQNIFDKEAWSPLPTGDGQTLSLRYQTSGKYYQTASLSFIEPWLGGKKPNSLRVSFSYSNVNFSQRQYNTGYRNSYYGGYSPYGYGNYGYSSPYGYGYSSPYGYGGYYPRPSYNYAAENTDNKKDQIWQTLAVGIGLGYRLSWPDDYFSVYHELSYEHYKLQNMGNMFGFLADEATRQVNGNFNNFNFNTIISRNSIINPLYSRGGSSFSLGLKITLPFSLLSGKDYSKLSNAERYKWIEYHKWTFKGQVYNSLSADQKLVLRTAMEMAFVGYYDKNAKSPFEGFIVGGSGMSGGIGFYGADYIAMRGYKDYSLSNDRNGSKMYSKFTAELRYPITLKPSATIYALGFLEAGNATSNFKSYNPFQLYRSAGVGLRIFLPMFGLMGIDWGYGFDEVPGNPSANKGQIHFTIGQQF